MTQEDEDLLLKDLSARLSYGLKAQVKINVEYSDAHKPNSETWVGDIWGITTNKPYTAWVYSMITIYPCGPEQNLCSISECKPYLRPMSSMTEEERKEWENTFDSVYDYAPGENEDNDNIVGWHDEPCAESFDWLNAHHFDYRRLIEKGLAIEAPEGMYN